MNYSKIKSTLSQQGKSINDLAHLFKLSKAGAYRIFSKQSMSVKQLERICEYINVSPVVFFDDSEIKPPNEVKSLISSLNDKVRLQEDIIQLLRDQLSDCKSKVDKPVLAK